MSGHRHRARTRSLSCYVTTPEPDRPPAHVEAAEQEEDLEKRLQEMQDDRDFEYDWRQELQAENSRLRTALMFASHLLRCGDTPHQHRAAAAIAAMLNTGGTK